MKRSSESVDSGSSQKVSISEPLSVPTAEHINGLEEAIAQSAKNYNKLVELVRYLKTHADNEETVRLVSVATFKAFGKLMKKGALSKPKTKTNAAEKVTLWLRDRYTGFKNSLISLLSHENSNTQVGSLAILFRLVKEEGVHFAPNVAESYFPKQIYRDIIKALIQMPAKTTTDLYKELVQSYLTKYDDLRYYFWLELSSIVSEELLVDTKLTKKQLLNVSNNLMQLLQQLTTNLPSSDSEIESFWTTAPESKGKSASYSAKASVIKASSHKLAFQKAWIAALRLPLVESQYKTVLTILHKRIIPNMVKPQLLMDFLTDSYDVGGVVSLLALNGLFSLMQSYNLDYPNFYTKLYALFDKDLMYVRYRSRFFRLVDLFLSSTHLPSAVAAAFIKKMSRLALYAPPSAIVTIIPFVYNQLKRHPTCMVLVHNPDFIKVNGEEFTDPFLESELNPLETQALSSSLWELETLQSHYHPNVATLARIMSEQFRKESYHMEDFLDLSYASLFAQELTRRIKVAPALEFESFKSVLAKENKNDEDQGEIYMADWSL